MAHKADLERLIGIVEAKLAALPVLAPMGDTTDWRLRQIEANAYHRAAEQSLADLVEHGGRVCDVGGHTTLRLGGFSAGCTHGAAGVMHNWLVGAKRRITKIEVA